MEGTFHTSIYLRLAPPQRNGDRYERGVRTFHPLFPFRETHSVPDPALQTPVGDEMEHSEDGTPGCDWVEECELPGTELIVVDTGDGPVPAGFLCKRHNQIVKDEVTEGDKKLAIDVHFHRHSIIGVVSDEEDKLASGERYTQGAMIQ